MNPTMLVTVCGILPRTTSNFKSFHWNSAVLPDLQRGCAALNDVIMSLRRECDKCHFLDYNPLFDRSMHLARDGLHVNINGAYVLKTVLESFVVSLDMEQINSAEKVLSLDLVDTRMSYADVVKHFPPRDKLKSMDYKDKESCICSKKPFIPKFRRYKRYRVPISTRVKKDRHIHAACTHQKPKLKRFIQKIIPAKVFCCPECHVKCTKEDFLLNHYLSRHVPHRKKMEIMYKDASFKPNHMKIECSWESCTETFQTEQLLGQHVIGHVHPGMLCQWKDCAFTTYDGNELETHVLKHRKMRGSHKSHSRPDKVYKYNLSNLKERKLKLAVHAENYTNLELCACFVLATHKGFTVKIGKDVLDAYYMSCDNEMLKTPAIRDIICHYPEIRILDHYEKSSVSFSVFNHQLIK